MTYEEVKNLLKSVRSKKSRLLSMQAYIAEVRQIMLGVTSPQLDGVAVAHSQNNCPEERIIRYMDRYNKWKELYDKLFDEMCAEEDKLCEMMRTLSPTEYDIILNRYLMGFSVRKTANLMSYEEQTVKNMCRTAIKKMAKT